MDEFEKIYIENYYLQTKDNKLSQEHKEFNQVLDQLKNAHDNLKMNYEELKHDLHLTRTTCDYEHKRAEKLEHTINTIIGKLIQYGVQYDSICDEINDEHCDKYTNCKECLKHFFMNNKD